MRCSSLRLSLAAIVTLFLVACSSTPKCTGDQEYLQAVERPRLQLPAHVTASERMAPLVIPPPAADAAKLDPAPNCLDEPPSYATGPRSTAAAGQAPGDG
jgi:uncharacterized lipoprotein